VAAGSRPVITALRAEVRCSSANADRTGNPTTAPAPTDARRSHWLPLGRGCRVAARHRAERPAATTALPRETKIGARLWSASLVAGRVRLKAATPTVPRRIASSCRDAEPTDGELCTQKRMSAVVSPIQDPIGIIGLRY